MILMLQNHDDDTRSVGRLTTRDKWPCGEECWRETERQQDFMKLVPDSSHEQKHTFVNNAGREKLVCLFASIYRSVALFARSIERALLLFYGFFLVASLSRSLCDISSGQNT